MSLSTIHTRSLQGHPILGWFGDVFSNDRESKEKGLTDEQRLFFHKRNSGPVMGRLYGWCKKQLDENKVEPNSNLGKAIKYTLKHWKGLTLFLHVPGAPTAIS